MVRWSPPGRLAMPGKEGCAGLAPPPAQPSPRTAQPRGDRLADDGGKDVIWHGPAR